MIAAAARKAGFSKEEVEKILHLGDRWEPNLAGPIWTEEVDGVFQIDQVKATKMMLLLARDERDWVRYGIHWGKSLPLEVLEILSRDSETSVRAGVAGHPNASMKILDRLSRHNWCVQNCLASHNPRATPGMLRRIVKSKDWTTRRSAMQHRNCPTDVLERLASDPMIGDEARKRLKARNAQPK